MRYEDAFQSGSSNTQNPDARDDADALAAGDRGPATGNVISGEGTQTGALGADLGADGARIVSISGAQGSDDSFAGGRLSANGEFGRLSIDAEGNYSYLANQGAPENSRDIFTYKLADAQNRGDTIASSTASLVPDPIEKCAVCAASPSNTSLPSDQRSQVRRRNLSHAAVPRRCAALLIKL